MSEQEPSTGTNSYLCPGCENPLRIPSGHAGSKVRCKKCDETFEVPSHPFRLHRKKGVNCKICETKYPENEKSSSTGTPETNETTSSTRSKKEYTGSSNASTDQKILCPGCEEKLRVPTSVSGKKVRCKHCESLFRIPDSGPTTERTSQTSSPKKPSPDPPKQQSEEKQTRNQDMLLYACENCNHLYVLAEWLFGKQALCDNCNRTVQIEGKDQRDQVQLKQRVSRGESPTFSTNLSGWKMGPSGEFIPVIEEDELTDTDQHKAYWNQLMANLSETNVEKTATKQQQKEQYDRKNIITGKTFRNRKSTLKKLATNTAVQFSLPVLFLITGLAIWLYPGNKREETVQVATSSESNEPDSPQENRDQQDIDLTRTSEKSETDALPFEDQSESGSASITERGLNASDFVSKDLYTDLSQRAKLLLLMREDPAILFYHLQPEHRTTALRKVFSMIQKNQDRSPMNAINGIRTFFPPSELNVQFPAFWIEALTDMVHNNKLDTYTRAIVFLRLRKYVKRLTHHWGSFSALAPPNVPSILLMTSESSLKRYIKTLLHLMEMDNTFLSTMARNTVRENMLHLKNNNVQGSYWFSFLVLEQLSNRRQKRLNLQRKTLQSALERLSKQNRSMLGIFPALRDIFFSSDRSRKQAQKLVTELERALSKTQGRKAQAIGQIMGLPGWSQKIHENIFQTSFEQLLSYIYEGGDVYISFLKGAAMYAYLRGVSDWYSRIRSVFVRKKSKLSDGIRRGLYLQFDDREILSNLKGNAGELPTPVFVEGSGSQLSTGFFTRKYLRQGQARRKSSFQNVRPMVRSELWMQKLNPGIDPPDKQWIALLKQALKRKDHRILRQVLTMKTITGKPETLIEPLLKLFIQYPRKNILLNSIVKLIMFDLSREKKTFSNHWKSVKKRLQKKFDSNMEKQNQLLIELRKQLLWMFFRCYPEKAHSFVLERFDRLQISIRHEIFTLIASSGLYDLGIKLLNEQDHTFLRKFPSLFIDLFGVEKTKIRKEISKDPSSGDQKENASRLTPVDITDSWLTKISETHHWFEWVIQKYGANPNTLSEYVRSFSLTYEELNQMIEDLSRKKYQKTLGRSIRKVRNFFSLLPTVISQNEIQNLRIKLVSDLPPDQNKNTSRVTIPEMDRNIPANHLKSDLKWKVIRPENPNLLLTMNFLKVQKRWKIFDISVSR